MLSSGQSQSSQIHPPIHSIGLLKADLKVIATDFQLFQESTMGLVHQWCRSISMNMLKSCQQRKELQVELDNSRAIQNSMRAEVIQLKEMIHEAMADYTRDLKTKDKEIAFLKAQLNNTLTEKSTSQDMPFRPEKQPHDQTQGSSSLQIIQEQSQNATYSSTTSLREFREELSQERQPISIIPQSHCTLPTLQPISTQPPSEQRQPPKSDHKRAKNFIQNFRKNIQLSFYDTPIEQLRISLPPDTKQNLTPIHPTAIQHFFRGEPMREISNLQHPHHSPISISNYLKNPPRHNEQNPKPRTIHILNSDGQHSNCSSTSSLERLSEQERHPVNEIKKFQTPLCLFSKKKPLFHQGHHQRFKTQPSPEQLRPHPNSSNNCSSHKATRSQLSHDRRPSSVQGKRKGSKEKIKVTSRMVEEAYQPKRNHNAAKAVVFLGGKSVFRKFLQQIKTALCNYSLSISGQELTYDGELRAGKKCGRGRIIMRDGRTYEGEFRDGQAEGRGVLSLNGVVVYQGQWVQGWPEGQGYLKSLRWGGECPGMLNQASYCGYFEAGRFHGIGTLFLNGRQKIVTKFRWGQPVGELTYYNIGQIEFGVWPGE